MSNKALAGLLALAAIVIVFLALYLFYPGVLPHLGPEKPQEPTKKTAALPEPQEKPGEQATPAPAPAPAPAPTPPPAPAPAPAPAPQAPPQPTPPPPAAAPEKPVTKPEPTPAAPKEAELPALQPKEGYGLLAGSFRGYASASKMLEKLKKQGQEAFIRRDRGKYQVWVGPFPTRQEAEEAAKSIQQKMKIRLKIEKMVTPVPK